MSDTEPHVAETLEDLPDMTDLLSRSGLEFMQDILSGKLSGPPIGATMGFELTSVEKGRVVFSGTPEFHVTNPMRGVHGGWYGTLLDSCMACALMTMLQKGQHYTTLEYKVNITRAIPLGTRVDGIGQVSHAGRRTGVSTGEIRGAEDGKLYATASTTCLIMSADG
ncbi:PaaI family thioesterase [Roseovarius sp.]|uniref:PaaI family thioesterase n=1 Tax=Roseovarius sp. TaxID=1486281 RepID=UPI0026256C87|nr:PaaI family thioesterase [Roseovarius sp.]MDM8168159.1 PaaI family thioesterase [Roseovarius sp.]